MGRADGARAVSGRGQSAWSGQSVSSSLDGQNMTMCTNTCSEVSRAIVSDESAPVDIVCSSSNGAELSKDDERMALTTDDRSRKQHHPLLRPYLFYDCHDATRCHGSSRTFVLATTQVTQPSLSRVFPPPLPSPFRHPIIVCNMLPSSRKPSITVSSPTPTCFHFPLPSYSSDFILFTKALP